MKKNQPLTLSKKSDNKEDNIPALLATSDAAVDKFYKRQTQILRFANAKNKISTKHSLFIILLTAILTGFLAYLFFGIFFNLKNSSMVVFEDYVYAVMIYIFIYFLFLVNFIPSTISAIRSHTKIFTPTKANSIHLGILLGLLSFFFYYNVLVLGLSEILFIMFVTISPLVFIFVIFQ